MAMIHLSFDNYEDMVNFSKKVMRMEERQPALTPNPSPKDSRPEEAPSVQAPMQSQTPRPVQAVPTVPYGQQIAQNFPQANTAAPQPAPVQQPAPVATTQHTYTLDELASAAMQLMDKGMQAKLQELLAGYGVEALPQLPKEQYGNFATAIRGMGAEI